MKNRISMIFLQYGQVDVQDGAFVLIDKNGVRTHIPVGSIACIMLEPGTQVIVGQPIEHFPKESSMTL